MDLEVEALLFKRPSSQQRKNFKSTLFVERSTKLKREVWIYSLLAHLIWIELEADPHVLEYNEAPRPIPIPIDNRILEHQFRFAVRRDDGTVQVIVTKSNHQTSNEDVVSDPLPESRELQAIRAWSQSQGVECRYLTTESFAGMGPKLANFRKMLKFIETASGSHLPHEDETIQNTIRLLAPVQIRRVLQSLAQFEETKVIAVIARNILNGHYSAAIDRREFDGLLVINFEDKKS
ncbi:MAG: hypothetical protein Q7U94_06290 [Sideroxyarcus sp.]|nr:hypothetical protein [Sideroxyarcus sp.]